MKPKIASGFAKYCLVVVVDLLMTYPTWIDRWGVRVLRIKNHWLVRWIDLAGRDWHRFRSRWATRIRLAKNIARWTAHGPHRSRAAAHSAVSHRPGTHVHAAHVIHVSTHLAHWTHVTTMIHAIHSTHTHVAHHARRTSHSSRSLTRHWTRALVHHCVRWWCIVKRIGGNYCISIT